MLKLQSRELYTTVVVMGSWLVWASPITKERSAMIDFGVALRMYG